MRWVDKVLKQIDQSIEWQSLGSIAWRFHADEGWLQIAPGSIEVVGGADDGEYVHPFYSLHVGHFIGIFDGVPEMQWDTMHGEISLEGKIDADDAWITFLDAPFDDDEPHEVLDPDGGIRPKKPPKQ